MKRLNHFMTMPLVLLLAAACQADFAQPDSASTRLELADRAAEALVVFLSAPNSDAAHLALSARLPALAGVYFEEGVTHVRLRSDASDQDRQLGLALEVRMAPLAQRAEEGHGRFPVLSPEVPSQAAFTFVQLAGFRDGLLSILSEPHVNYLDIDERTNQVVVGISEGGDGAAMRRFAEARGVPLEALTLRPSKAFHQFATLQSEIRPVRGGMRIELNGGGFCSLGYAVFHNVRGETGFITNSHCTNINGGTEGTLFGQPNQGVFGLSRIGVEQIDPFYFSNRSGCPPGRRCRFSDSAYARFNDPAAQARRGFVAAPTTFCSLPTISCTLNLPSTSSEMRVTGSTGFPMLGSTFDKVGQATGWTFGQTTQTCFTVNIMNLSTGQDTGKTLICQDAVAAGAATGDSGAPVFEWHGSTILATGLLWGGSGQEFGFSYIGQVNSELGSINYNAP